MKKYKGLHTVFDRRITLVCAAIVVFSLVITGKLVYLMLINSETLSGKAKAIEERERSIKAKRGVIYDRNGISIADNKVVCSVSVIHRQITEPEKVIESLTHLLDMDEETVRKKVNKVSSREKIKSNVDKKLGDELRSLKLDGVMVDDDYKRYYPYDTLASKVIGFTGGDNQGIVGIEAKYDQVLAGKAGSINTYTDSTGMPLDIINTRVEPIPGNNLVLTIDKNIQSYVENKAMEVLERKNAKRVCIIVMNPQNGEIYAMTDVPEYNLNKPYELDNCYEKDSNASKQDKLNSMWRCFLVSDTYEPGSAFKIVTATAALETATVNENDWFFCPGYRIVNDRRIKCHKVLGHGAESFKEGLMNSCNPVFMDVGLRLGATKFYKYAKLLGLFEKTGIDLPGEANSIFHKLEDVKPVDLAIMSFGQSFQITPLQLVRAASAVVNGGSLVTPHLGKYVTDKDNHITKIYEYKKAENAINGKTSEQMRRLLDAVVSEGTGCNAYVPGFDIGGKTATSQKLPRGSGKYIASFIGFAPSDNPTVLTLVLIDEPEGVYYGGTVAAPVAGEVFQNILPYLGINRKAEDNKKESTDVFVDTVY